MERAVGKFSVAAVEAGRVAAERAGIGYGWARQSSTRFYNNVTGIPRFSLGGTEGALAYQAIVGGAFNIPYMRGLAMTVEYRFFGMGSRSYDTLIATSPSTAFGSEVKLGNNFNQSVLIGLRYNFSAPPPPPPPAPAPVPARHLRDPIWSSSIGIRRH